MHPRRQFATVVAYDDELKNGWQNWRWAKVALVKVEGDRWSALAPHHDAYSTEGLRKLTLYVNGGAQGGQSLMVKATVDKKAVPSEFLIEPKAGDSP